MGVRVVVDGRDRSRAVYVVSIALLALLQSLQHAHTLPYRGSSEGMYMLRASTRRMILRRVPQLSVAYLQLHCVRGDIWRAIFEGYTQFPIMHAHEAFQRHRRTTFIAVIAQNRCVFQFRGDKNRSDGKYVTFDESSGTGNRAHTRAPRW